MKRKKFRVHYITVEGNTDSVVILDTLDNKISKSNPEEAKEIIIDFTKKVCSNSFKELVSYETYTRTIKNKDFYHYRLKLLRTKFCHKLIYRASWLDSSFRRLALKRLVSEMRIIKNLMREANKKYNNETLRNNKHS